MTHPNFQTNGASLEDCHTNFFALTELSGIKWRKLTWCDSGGGGLGGVDHPHGCGGGGHPGAHHNPHGAAAGHPHLPPHHPAHRGGPHPHLPPPPCSTTGYHCSSSEPLEDPVLRSYARCLAADILCVWRRASTPARSAASQQPQDVYDLGAGMPPPPQQHHHQPPPLSLAAAKELWIFWYGEEPDLSELVAPEINMTGKFHFMHSKTWIGF
ncbi:unnamed protein product, partial [Callosobruchus maculatus]